MSTTILSTTDLGNGIVLEIGTFKVGDMAEKLAEVRSWRDRKLAPLLELHSLNLPGDSGDGAHAPHTSPLPAPRSTPGPNGRTTRSLRRFAARLLHPLTKAGAERLPLYYLVMPPLRPLPAPPGAPRADRTRRSCERAAIALWWPIARLLTLWRLWHHPPPLRVALGAWRVAATASHHHTTAAAHTGTAEPCAGPAQGPEVSSSDASAQPA